MTNSAATNTKGAAASPAAPPLPKGWRWARLGEVCALVAGTTPDSSRTEYWNGEIVWVTPTDLGRLTSPRITTSGRRISRQGFESCNLSLVPPGAVVLSSRAPIGHLGVAAVSLCTNQGCKSFVPGREVDSGFLYYALRLSVSRLQRLGSGATFAEVSKSALAQFEIPLPPLAEQKQIATILEEQLAAVERARAAAEGRLEAAKALPGASLRSVFDSPDAKLWPRLALGDLLAAPLKTGISKTGSAQSERHCLTLSAVRNGELDLTAKKGVDVTEQEAAGNWVVPGVLYVVRGNGNINLVGRGALAPPTVSPPVLYPDLLIAVRVKPDVVDTEYLRWVWDCSDIRRQVEQKARTAAGIYKINQRNLETVIVPFPDMAMQQRIAAILKGEFAEAQRARAAAEEQLEAVNALPAALLRRAFNGEI